MQTRLALHFAKALSMPFIRERFENFELSEHAHREFLTKFWNPSHNIVDRQTTVARCFRVSRSIVQDELQRDVPKNSIGGICVGIDCF